MAAEVLVILGLAVQLAQLWLAWRQLQLIISQLEKETAPEPSEDT